MISALNPKQLPSQLLHLLPKYMNRNSIPTARVDWFRNQRFGIFVHFGCYSVLGRGEQVMMRDLMLQNEYEELAAQFCPAPGWAERLVHQAADAGAKYMVLTTRHHDGYCLFPTGTHDYHAVATGPGRDLVSEYVEACRAAGLGVGLYYSVHSWRWHGFWDPEKYPQDLPKMVDEMHTQVEELMRNYGPIDILWYDSPMLPGKGWPGHHHPTVNPVKQSAAEFYRSAELNAKVRELQPDILINNRSGLPEDFGTPEQKIEAEEGDRPWEACMTSNACPGWGYVEGAVNVKSPGEVLRHLVDAVRQGGNFLFNVGPMGDGFVHERDTAILRSIGGWLRRNGEAIYGTRPGQIYDGSPFQWPYFNYQGPCFQDGMFTQRGNRAYLTLFFYTREIIINRLQPDIVSAHILSNGQPLELVPIRNNRWRIGGLPEKSPDPLATVVVLEFSAPPRPFAPVGADWLDGVVSEAP